MKIWVIEIGEPLPLEKDVRLHRYGQFTKVLASYGHDITWWTSSFSHAPKKNFVFKDEERILDGVRIKFIFSEGYPKNISFKRIKHNKLIAKRFSEWAVECEPPDLIIAPIPTIETAEEAVKFAKARNIPVILDVRDHWPDELRDLAPRFLRPLAQLALFRSYSRMKYVCENAKGILGVSEKSVEYGLQFANRPRSKFDKLFPLGYSAQPVSSDKIEQAKKWCAEIGLDGSAFICCFFGTIGQFFNLKTVIDAARILKNEFKIQFLIGGDGAALSKYKKMAEDLDNVIFPGWIGAPQISAVMSISKVGLAPYAVGTMMSLPNKPFEYMSAGLPVVSSIQHELKGLLEKHNAGRTYHADSPSELCSIIRELKSNEENRVKIGQNAKELFEANFRTDAIFKAINNHFEFIVSSSKSERT